MTGYRVTVTTWDQSGRRRDEALDPDTNNVAFHLLGIGTRALGLFPELDSVVFKSKQCHSEITVYRKGTSES